MKHIIIGAGIAGVAAAQAIKNISPEAEVTLIGEEGFFPYNRHLLTEYLCDSIREKTIFYTSAEFFAQKGIKFRKGQYVKSIDPTRKSIKFFHNEVMSYDKLLIATGGSPTLGPVLRPYAKNIQRYYSLQDILLVKRKLSQIKHCVIFGGGLSALDLMCGMCNLNKKVTYIVKGTKFDFHIIDAEFMNELEFFLKQHGIEIIYEDRIISIDQFKNRYRVLTLNQKELEADIVFAWDHYKPNIDCVKGTNIEKKIGLLVDQYLQTSVDQIYAAGDCVEIYHPEIKNYWINFGWPNATQQGKIAGKNMTGLQEKYNIKETIVFKIMGKSLRARWWN